MRARLVATSVAMLVVAGSFVGSAPAHAGVFGLDEKITDYRWSPRTGEVSVLVEASCPKRMWRAEVGIELTQKRVTARDDRRVQCDGEAHTIRLQLDPKRGRFHPGAVDAIFRTGECVSDYCGFAELHLSDVRIPPPGKARGIR